MARLEHDWYAADLPSGVEIGERAWLYSSFAFLHCRSEKRPSVTIGDDSGVYNGTFFELGAGGSLRLGRFSTLVGAIIRYDCAVLIGSYVYVAHEVVMAESFAIAPPLGAS